MQDKKSRPVRTFSSQELQADMQKYQQAALESGATDAKVITAEDVRVDKRVRIKCMIPKCPMSGSCANCPPYSLDTDKIRELVSCYQQALLVKLNMDSGLMAGEDLGVIDDGGKVVPSKKLRQLLNQYRKLNDLVTELESQAFYDGHYLAVSFAAGDCNSVYCNFQECQVLKGNPCRFPLRARPSMESSSINAYLMAAEAGWDVYPIGSNCDPDNVPHGTLLGLVLVD